jgi:hypothetical protein
VFTPFVWPRFWPRPGSRKAADLLASSEVAVVLAKMDRSAKMLNGGEKYFFGQEPKMLENIFVKKSV